MRLGIAGANVACDGLRRIRSCRTSTRASLSPTRSELECLKTPCTSACTDIGAWCYQCPSTSGYRCFSITLPATLDVALPSSSVAFAARCPALTEGRLRQVAGGNARLEVEPKEQLIPDLNKGYQMGRLSASLALDAFSGDQLRSAGPLSLASRHLPSAFAWPRVAFLSGLYMCEHRVASGI